MKKRYIYNFALVVAMITVIAFFCSIMLAVIILCEGNYLTIILVSFGVFLGILIPIGISFASETFSVDEKGIVFYKYGREEFVFPWEEMESAQIGGFVKPGGFYQFTTIKDVSVTFEIRKSIKKLLKTYAPKKLLEMIEESRLLQNLSENYKI